MENAQGYEYQYDKNGETVSGVTTDNWLAITGLPVGEYTVYLRAVSDDENFSNSESIAFTFMRERAELWRTPCSYYSEVLDQTFSCDVVAYDDGNYLGGGHDEVTWGGEDEPTESIDFLVGDYTETSSCYDLTIDWTNWVKITDKTSDVRIEKVDDTTVTLYNFYGLEDTLTGTVDLAARTITFSVKADFAGYYTFCQYDAPDTPVVADIADDGTITVSNWTLWYAQNSYSYIYSGAQSVLVKK